MQQNTGPGRAPAQGPVRLMIWLALTASVFVYGAVGFVVTRSMEPRDVTLPAWLFPMLALMTGAVAFALHRRLGESAPRDTAAARPLEIQVWALDEAIAVFGLVNVLLTGSFSAYAGYGMAALVLLVLHRPR